jgi:hypothetical protein
MAETIAVAHALGHSGLEFESCMRDMNEVLTRAGEGRASMLQDFDAGRRTEVDALNGAVVRAAERLMIDVPDQPRAALAREGLGAYARAQLTPLALRRCCGSGDDRRSLQPVP